jgi:hypothetical protein
MAHKEGEKEKKKKKKNKRFQLFLQSLSEWSDLNAIKYLENN